ncbi:MAG: hypothetical protein HAW67_07485 [Endozoicomonadaceae bacterium]|nr:hypothetical protein [Endozoicomonadaceae bacterium]
MTDTKTVKIEAGHYRKTMPNGDVYDIKKVLRVGHELLVATVCDLPLSAGRLPDYYVWEVIKNDRYEAPCDTKKEAVEWADMDYLETQDKNENNT